MDEIFGMIVVEPIDSEFSISSRGFDYESRGYASDKFEEFNLYYIMVAGDKVSGEIVVSKDKYNDMDLNGIHSIVSIAE